VLILRFPNYKETLALANSDSSRPFTTVEDSCHPTNHAVIGYLLAKSWGLSDELCKAIRMHHAGFPQLRAGGVPDVSRRLIAAGLLAERSLQTCFGQGQTMEWEKDGEHALVELGITETQFIEHLDAIRAQLDSGQSP
jgi:HD-like signal output (HDOD) protein